MKTNTIIKIEKIGIAFFLIYSIVILFLTCSCVSIKDAIKIQDSTIPVKVDKVKHARSNYYAYECSGIYNSKKYYLTGLKDERNISDTTYIRIYQNGMIFFVKTN